MRRQQQGKGVDWDAIAKQACIGMGAGFVDDAKKLSEFVRVWSGGVDGHILKDLEMFERALKVKRKLYSHDLQSLSKIDFVDYRDRADLERDNRRDNEKWNRSF